MIDQHAAAQDFDTAQAPRAGEIRAIAASEFYHFQWHLLRLDGGCRRSRFGNSAPDTFVCDYAGRVDSTNTVVLGFFVAGHMRGAAELRSLGSTWCEKAEVAFSVETAWQGRGVGTALMQQIIAAARERGVEHVYLTCHAFNRRIQRMAERVAAKLQFDDCECLADIDLGCEETATVLAPAGEDIAALAVR